MSLRRARVSSLKSAFPTRLPVAFLALLIALLVGLVGCASSKPCDCCHDCLRVVTTDGGWVTEPPIFEMQRGHSFHISGSARPPPVGAAGETVVVPREKK